MSLNENKMLPISLGMLSAIIVFSLLKIELFVYLLTVCLMMLISFHFNKYRKLQKAVAAAKENVIELDRQLVEKERTVDELSHIMNTISQVTFSYDTRTKSLYISKGIEKYVGFASDEIISNPLLLKQKLREWDEQLEEKLISRI